MNWVLKLRKFSSRLPAFQNIYWGNFLKSQGKGLPWKSYLVNHAVVRDPKCFLSVNFRSLQTAGVSQCRNFHTAGVCPSSEDSEKTTDRYKNITSDTEYQDILKDFARDFEVTDKGSEVLEEIKCNNKSLNENDTTPVKCQDYGSDLEGHSFVGNQFKEFSDKDAVVIHSYEEEQNIDCDSEEIFFHIDQEENDKHLKYVTKRGKSGVYDLDELVDVLKGENIFDICVIQPPELCNYVDYMVVATAKSPRHLRAVMEFVVFLYKRKKNKNDPFVEVEGLGTSPWNALDLGNIALHLFLKDTRREYDMESLWALDKDFDSGGTRTATDPIMEMMKEHLDFMDTHNTL